MRGGGGVAPFERGGVTGWRFIWSPLRRVIWEALSSVAYNHAGACRGGYSPFL